MVGVRSLRVQEGGIEGEFSLVFLWVTVLRHILRAYVLIVEESKRKKGVLLGVRCKNSQKKNVSPNIPLR